MYFYFVIEYSAKKSNVNDFVVKNANLSTIICSDKELKMAQKCIFCGGEPQNKNKEHVIPQWLSKYLGRYRDICYMPNITDKKIPFCGLVFPACEKCNSDDSVLEVGAKKVVEKMMAGQSVTGAEINTLLDWFDKLRHGFWLGELMLSKKLDEIDPNFYINTRIGQKDRMLIIERFKDVGNGLGILADALPGHKKSPNVMQFWFNDVVLTSVSVTGLVSNKLGFPCVSQIERVSRQIIEFELSPGRNKTTHPVVMNIDATDKTIIYQPIFKEYQDAPYYDVPYVKEHCYDFDNGLGGIFVQRHDNKIRYMGKDDKVTLVPKIQPKSAVEKSVNRVFEMQNYVLDDLYKKNSARVAFQKYIDAQAHKVQQQLKCK